MMHGQKNIKLKQSVLGSIYIMMFINLRVENFPICQQYFVIVCGKLCSTPAGQRKKGLDSQTNKNLLRTATIID